MKAKTQKVSEAALKAEIRSLQATVYRLQAINLKWAEHVKYEMAGLFRPRDCEVCAEMDRVVNASWGK